MLLLASIALALPATAFVASNYQSHTPRAMQASLANAPFDHIVTVMLENQGLCSVYVGCVGSRLKKSTQPAQKHLVTTCSTIKQYKQTQPNTIVCAIKDVLTSYT